jgi:SNF2 family DNA or RNA helicase
METVKLKMHKGEICALIPPGLVREATRIRGGKYDHMWKCWRFQSRPHVAAQIISAFKFCISYCDKEIKELASSFETSKQVKADSNLPDIPGLKHSAWAHQRQGYHFVKDLPGACLAMAMGTGKTLTAIGLIKNRPHDMVLIVAPKSVISVWPSEFRKHSTETFHIVAPVKGSVRNKVSTIIKEKKLAEAKNRPFVLIVNYEAYWREPMKKWITSQDWDQIIYDECHRIKAPKGKASSFAASLVGKARYRLGLTGTLLPHSPLDVFAQYKAVDPTVFGSSYHRFKKRYAEFGGFNAKEIVGFKNEQELNQKIEAIAYQVDSDVLNLPEAIHMYRTCQLDDKTRKLYDDLDQALYAEIDSGEITVANAMVKVLRLQQLTSGYLKTDEGELVQYGNEKLNLFKELLGEIPAKEPVVIFCRFTSDIANVKAACKDAGRTCAELSGHENSLAEWQDGKYDCIAVQIRSGGVGIDLTRACYCVYYSMGHSLGDFSQSLARTNRPGQTRTVRYYHLLAEGTVDPTIYQALSKKQKVVDYILKGVKVNVSDLD